jgi:alpha-D-ribose 1-methylphosphonate 5-triphosphate diphosphatase
MKPELTLINGKIITSERIFCGSVRVIDGMIRAVDSGMSSVKEAVDLNGDYILPGLIELHTDHLERHFSPRPGVRWPSIAATLSHDAAVTAAGITTVFDALAIGDTVENSQRLRDLQGMIEAIKMAQEKNLLRSEHYLHLRCEIGYPHVLELFEPLVRDGLVKLVSLMDHTPGQRQFTRIEKLFEYYQGKYGFTEKEMEKLMVERQENQKIFASHHRRALIRICADLGIPVASHDDTTVEHIVEAVSEGVVLSEFPTTMEAAKAAKGYGLKILMGSPNLVLGGSHSGNASALELARVGCVDILSSDYVPASLLHGVFLLHQKLGLPLPHAVAMVTSHPAELVNLKDRGEIKIGKRADLIQVRVEEGLPVVTGVWRRGQQIF